MVLFSAQAEILKAGLFQKRIMVYMGPNHKCSWYVTKSDPGLESEAVCLFHIQYLFLEAQYQSFTVSPENSRRKYSLA